MKAMCNAVNHIASDREGREDRWKGRFNDPSGRIDRKEGLMTHLGG